jgi:hypothetical protein
MSGGVTEVLVRPADHRLLRGLQRPVAREHNDRDVRIELPEFLERADAVHLRHPNVEDNDGEGLGPDQVERDPPAGGSLDGELRGKAEGDRLAGAVLVIHHQHGRKVGRARGRYRRVGGRGRHRWKKGAPERQGDTSTRIRAARRPATHLPAAPRGSQGALIP